MKRELTEVERARQRVAAAEEARVAAAADAAVAEVAAALEALEHSRERVVSAIRSARELEVPYRRLAERTGRSSEYFRSVVNRSA